jgi:hypothetical protein
LNIGGFNQEQPKLSLEQWRLTTDNGDHSLELWSLIMELKIFRSSWS